MSDLEITDVAVTLNVTIKHQRLAELTLKRVGDTEYRLTVTAYGPNETECRQRLTELKRDVIEALGGTELL